MNIKSRTLGVLLNELAVKYAENEVLVYKDKRYTYAQLKEEADRVARNLIGMGLKPGDKVGLFVNSSDIFLILVFGILKAGGVVVPFSTWYRAKEAEYGIRHCDVKILFTADKVMGFSFADMIQELLPEMEKKAPGAGSYTGYPLLQHVISVEKEMPGAHTWNDFLAFGKDVPLKAVEEAQASVDPNGTAMILLTSGTTAHPKAVQEVHRMIIENDYNIGERTGVNSNSRAVMSMPMFYGLFIVNAMMSSMSHGATMILDTSFDPGETLRLLEEEKATHWGMFYNYIAAVIFHPDFKKRNLSALTTGATIASPDELRSLSKQMFPKIYVAYGLTESHGFCTCSDVRDPLEDRIKGMGKILPGWEYKIVNPDTEKPVAKGTEGELYLKGYMTPGYYKDPENNETAFAKDGFYRTGDIVTEDEKGILTFITRAKEMIKASGINVAPASVEAYLVTNPKLKIVSVVGLPHKLKGQVVAAVIELKDGMEATEEEIIDFCKGKIAGYSVPRVVCFIKGSEWPLTVTGKIQKKPLEELVISKTGWNK